MQYVAILVDRKWKNIICSYSKDNNGRIISINFVGGDIDFEIISVYVPNISKDQNTFLDTLANIFGDKDKIIAGTSIQHIVRNIY